MKSILVGNGINIQFGNKAYSSDFIIKRAYFNSLQGKYDTLFNGFISGKEVAEIFKNFISIANKILDGDFDTVKEDSLLFAIKDFQKRYPKPFRQYHEIMLEDWFLLVRIFFIEYEDGSEQWQSAKQGFEQILLDAIYNEGEVELIYKRMPKPIKHFFKSFDNIFSLNYDSNIEQLTKQTVYHLHGCFEVLADSENKNTVLGFIRHSNGNLVLNQNFLHSFSNALLDYSGKLKKSRADSIKNLATELEKFKKLNSDDPIGCKVILENLKSINNNAYNIILTSIRHPELSAGTNYHFDELCDLTGELYIVGISPNNDSHVFDCINKSNLDKIFFYTYGTTTIDVPINKPYEVLNVLDLWNSLKAGKKTYNCSYKIPLHPDVNKFFNLFDTLSLDPESNEKIINELNSIPQFEIDRLCNLSKEVLLKHRKNGSPADEDELLSNFREISQLALMEGILPKTLFLIIIMNFELIK